MLREELENYLDGLLAVPQFRDYCPNGLQVEGRREIRKVVLGVTACQALLEAALERGADALIVHHGYFWKGENPAITGLRRQRLGTLIKNDINLFAYHLPLDAHPELGNNAGLAAALGWQVTGRFGEQNIGWLGALPEPLPLGVLADQLAALLQRPPLLIGDPQRPVARLAWCSGGAQGYFEQAVAAGVDLYLSGEISEPTVHLARESGVAYLACGHHATERFGVMALARHLRAEFGLNCEFVDIPNPV